MKNYLILFIILVTFNSGFGQKLFQEEPEVRVRIINNVKKLDFTLSGEWNITSGIGEEEMMTGNHNLKVFLQDYQLFMYKDSSVVLSGLDTLSLEASNSSAHIIIKNVPYGIGWWWEGKEDREYEGDIRIYVASGNHVEVIIHLPLEEYLKGVVPYEMGRDAPLEALKAQAVAARSEAIMALTSKRYSGPNYDITSDVECQVFSGNEKRTNRTDKAVDETKAIILSENGKPINAYYASNCGGHSEAIDNIWPDRPRPESYTSAYNDDMNGFPVDYRNEEKITKWILSSPDVFCNPNIETRLPEWSRKNFRWKREDSIATLSGILAKGKDFGMLKDIVPLTRGLSGRIIEAKFIFDIDTLITHGELAIRQLWKPPLRSSCFSIEKTENTFILNGAGWGHGVGMCQSGAISMALNGADFKAILKQYYKEAELMLIF